MSASHLPPSDSAADSQFDSHLRHAAEQHAPAPIGGGWERLRGRLPVPEPPALPPRRWGARPFAAGLLVGALLWWGGGELRPGGPIMGAGKSTMGAGKSTMSAGKPTMGAGKPTMSAGKPNMGAGESLMDTSKFVREIPGAATGAITLATIEQRDSVLHQEASAYLTPVAAPADTARATRLRTLIKTQRQALAHYAARLDSLKQFLPEAPPELAAEPAPLPAPDSTEQPLLAVPPRSPWAVALLLETTPNWSVLPTVPTGVVDQERTQASLTQSVQVQRQLSPQWRVRAGFGQATVQTQARYTSERTRQTTTQITTTKDDTSYRVRSYEVLIIGPTDTVRTLVSRLDTLVTQTITVRDETVTQRDKLQQLLRPTYRFWTLPVSAQRLLLTRPSWNLAASAGAQLAVLRDAQVPVWTGEQYALRRLTGPAAGLPRRASLSLSVGLEAQIRLSPRLTALVAPTLRGWAVPPGGAGRRVLPAAQVGLVWGW